MDLLVLVPSNSKSAAGRDKLAELIARKLMEKTEWSEWKGIR